ELLSSLRQAIAWLYAADQRLGGTSLPPAAPARGVPGRYEQLEYHAEGGMGIVYKALDVEARREVAYKVIHRQLAREVLAGQRFLKEARLTARLKHPGVVPIYGVITDATNRPSYAMRFLQGQPLGAAIAAFHKDHERLPTDAAAWRPLLLPFVRVCQTSGYAHGEGVLHRDLSPRNVMVMGTEETFVIDWGLATEDAATPLPPGAAATRAGVAAFMAPELWDDDHPGRHTSASDIYALGALLYLILTNHPPYEGSTPEVLAQMAAGP